MYIVAWCVTWLLSLSVLHYFWNSACAGSIKTCTGMLWHACSCVLMPTLYSLFSCHSCHVFSPSPEKGEGRRKRKKKEGEKEKNRRRRRKRAGRGRDRQLEKEKEEGEKRRNVGRWRQGGRELFLRLPAPVSAEAFSMPAMCVLVPVCFPDIYTFCLPILLFSALAL